MVFHRTGGGEEGDAVSLCKICGLWKETPNHRMNLEPLEERIRELEAELEEEHRQNVRNLARAEKAETRVAELEERIRSVPGFIEGWLGRHRTPHGAATEEHEREADQDSG